MTTSSHSIKAVVFDVFETLAHNNQQLWIDEFQSISIEQGLDIEVGILWSEWKSLEVKFRQERLNLENPEQCPPFKSYEEAWADCFSKVFEKLSLAGDPGQAAHSCVQAMGRHELYPDAKNVLEVIQERWKTGILSNADDDYLYPILNKLGLTFDVVLSSQAARCYKPMPALFLEINERLGTQSTEVVYIGDNQFDDVTGAKGVGMRAIWLNRKGIERDNTLSEPDCVITSLVELVGILEDWAL